RLPGLEQLDLVSTEAQLRSGFDERLQTWWPGLEEIVETAQSAPLSRPMLLAPSANEGHPYFIYRDREEELIGIVKRLRPERGAGGERGEGAPPSESARGWGPARSDKCLQPERGVLERVGVVYKRPLPYLYLAAETFGAAGIQYQTSDALPLAAEPTAAAL